MMEIKERLSLERELPGEAFEIEREFPLWLAEVQKEPLVLVIDGINQLQGSALSLAWLPKHIPPMVRLIVSSTVEQTLITVRERGWSQMGMQPLSEGEREAVVVRFLSQYHKALPVELVRQIAEDVKCAQPLFLRTLLEELRLFGVHEKLAEAVNRLLETTEPEDLFQLVLERMEADFGADQVGNVMTLLWASREGLRESELSEITGISRIKLSSLLLTFDYHLLRSDGHLSFFHDYLRRAVEKRYLADESSRRRAHLDLADYFESLHTLERSAFDPSSTPHRSTPKPSPSSLLELPWQLSEAGDTNRLQRALSRLDLLELFVIREEAYELIGYWLRCGGVRQMQSIYDSLLDALDWETPTEERMILLQHVCSLYQYGALTREAIPMSRRALAISEELYGVGHPSTASSLRNLSVLLDNAGEFAEGEAFARRSLAMSESKFGPEHLETAQYLVALARILRETGSYEEGEGLARRAFAIYEASIGPNHPRTAASLSYLATLVNDQGKHIEAEALHRRAVARVESVLGERHPKTADSLCNLAIALMYTGAYAESEALYRRAIEINQTSLGVDHPKVGDGLSNLATLLMRTGAYSEAEELLRRSLTILEKTLGAEHPRPLRR